MTQEWKDIFYPRIFLGVRLLKTLPEKGKLRSSLKESIRRDIQYFTEGVSQKLCSENALQWSQENNIDLTKLPPRGYGRIVGGPKNRRHLMLEHTTPIGALIEKMVNQDERKWELSMFLGSTLCWITREENDRLNKNGYALKRPGGWMKCYQESEINPRKIPTQDLVG